jgi:hypothetical protein
LFIDPPDGLPEPAESLEIHSSGGLAAIPIRPQEAISKNQHQALLSAAYSP